ncbi:MAG: hypothetical protein HWE39_03145 [Oceanospirillaceae bacterium]|nr:hypothetical protein [Oceanospirillaceae bacterium]
MFEAHFQPQADHNAFAAFIDPRQPRRLHSQRHQCPLYAWVAEGKRKDRAGIPHPHWFLYVEYCRRDGARDWVLIERPDSADLDSLFGEAQWLELPQIDPQRTRDWLDIDEAAAA